MSPVRSYEVGARSTDVFGRVLWTCRDQHFVADGPVHNGCPGEAVTPAELFLAGIASCGVELVQVVARDDGVAVGQVLARISGEIDPERPVRDDVTVFTSVRLELDVEGVTQTEAERLVEGSSGDDRCTGASQLRRRTCRSWFAPGEGDSVRGASQRVEHHRIDAILALDSAPRGWPMPAQSSRRS